jgi:hypothetical protein
MARSWGNGGALHTENMDSNGFNLLVRSDSGSEETPVWRAEIREADPGNQMQALRVTGRTQLTITEVGAAYPALKVEGKASFGSPEGFRTQPVLLADGRTELQAYPDQEGQPEEYALKVTGRTFFRRQQADDLMAVKVDGDVRIRLGEETPPPPAPPVPIEHTCGVLRPVTGSSPEDPDITQFHLKINAHPADRPFPDDCDEPHVKIGWNDGGSPSSGHGNVVFLRPKKLLLGLAPFELLNPDNYRIKAKGSMSLDPEDPADVALRVGGSVTVTNQPGQQPADINASGSVIAGQNVSAVGMVSGSLISSMGDITVAQNLSAGGAISGAAVAATGAVSGASVAATGTVSGANVAATGSV